MVYEATMRADGLEHGGEVSFIRDGGRILIRNAKDVPEDVLGVEDKSAGVEEEN